MGDRGNVVMLQNGGKDGAVYFYAHWTGESLPQTVQQALRRGRSRWGDEAYLGRIIFCEMLNDGSDSAEVLEDTTGFGITTYITDNEHPLLVVDDHNSEVGFVMHGSGDAPLNPMSFEYIEGAKWSFEDFLELRPPMWPGE